MALHRNTNITHSNDMEQMTRSQKIEPETQDQSISSNKDYLQFNNEE